MNQITKSTDVKETIEMDTLTPKQLGISQNSIHFGSISPTAETCLAVRGCQDCRGYVHDELRRHFLQHHHSPSKKVPEEEIKKLFETKPYRMLIGFARGDSKAKNNFFANWEWFKSWQKALNLQEPIIKHGFYKNPTYDTNDYFYVELDPVWQKGILQNSFCTFIMRTMAYHIYKEKINFKDLWESCSWREEAYLK